MSITWKVSKILKKFLRISVSEPVDMQQPILLAALEVLYHVLL